jgi:hypothetical protein
VWLEPLQPDVARRRHCGRHLPPRPARLRSLTGRTMTSGRPDWGLRHIGATAGQLVMLPTGCLPWFSGG